VSPLAFARVLLARWDRRVTAPRPLGLVFRAPPRPGRPPRPVVAPAAPALPRLHQSLRVDLRPALSLTVVRPAETSHTTTVLHMEPAEPGAERVSLEQLVIRDSSALAGARLVERVLSRSRRVELMARSAPPSAALRAREPELLGLPPRLVLQRAGSGSRSSRELASEAPPRTPAPPAQIQPALDLGRLTDQVMSAIDGRLTAHAERLGRG
jgi:hypothetical protein